MNIYGNYKSPLGYQSGENYIDSYGVDHSGFSTRDEIEYQMARLAKENQIMQNFNKRGITKNYPQYGTNFWGNSDNNYGFGNSQISSNIENMQKSFSADNFDITGRTNLNNTQNINGNTLGNIVNNTLTETKGYHSLSNMMDSNNYYNPIEQALQMDIASVLSPKPLGNDANSYQIAQNTTPNTVSDVASGKIDYSLYGNDFSKEFIDEMLNDKEFNQILNEYIIPNEGGLSDKPNDRGKLTKFGISKNTYPNEDILNLIRERANAIIYRDFYKWNGLNKLPYPIRGFVVDYGMPSSPLNAIKTVHKVLGLPSKGNIIGPATMEKLKNFSQQDYEKFLEQYKQSMLEYYNNIGRNDSTQKGNLKGWLNRANRAHLGK